MDELEKKAKEIIKKIIYITIATVSKDGIPWNTPIFTAYDKDYNFYWRSEKDAIHSQNIKENNKIFITICDTTTPWGEGKGIYIKGHAIELTNADEINNALTLLDKRSPRSLGNDANNFLHESPRRVYKAMTETIWMNDGDEINGYFIDKRIEIKLI
jgi:uncharacterized protein YhbP (UPF0306 family)